MGDAGANPLGAVLGYWVVLRSSPIVKTSVLLLLIGVHIYSERRSLSITIDANPVLRFIDLLDAAESHNTQGYMEETHVSQRIPGQEVTYYEIRSAREQGRRP